MDKSEKKFFGFSKKNGNAKNKGEEKAVKLNRYEQAKMEYLNTHMNLAKSLHSWKITALISLTGMLACIAFVFYLSTRSSLIPYVIEVDSLTGNAKGINVAMDKTYNVTEANKEYHLREFLKRFRNLSNDVYVVNNFFQTNSYYLTPAARKKYDKVIREEKITQLFKEGYTRQIEISSVNKLASNSPTVSSYQVRWKEDTFGENGDLVKEKRYSGVFTLEIDPPNNVEALRANPLGIKIRDFSVSLDN